MAGLQSITTEQILQNAEIYIGPTQMHRQELWVYEGDPSRMAKRRISYVPGLFKIYDEIILKAAENPNTDMVKVNIDVGKNLISVHYRGIPVKIYDEKKRMSVLEFFSGHFPDGPKLTNIFSSEFKIEIADGKSRYKQVFSNNMGKKTEATTKNTTSDENWTRVSFKPDLRKFGMLSLAGDVLALMKKRVIDLAGCLGETVKIKLDGKLVPPRTFKDYTKLYFPSTDGTLRLLYEKFDNGWEVCVGPSDGHFEQVSFVNNISTVKGGIHVEKIAQQIADYLAEFIEGRSTFTTLDAFSVKNYLRVFVNARIENPQFSSQTKQTLADKQTRRGSTLELTKEFLQKVAKSGIVKSIVNSWEQFELEEEQNDLNKTDGKKRGKLKIPKLVEAKYAASTKSGDCTLILTEGDSAKALVMSGLSTLGHNYYGVFPLRGTLLNVKKATAKKLQENTDIRNIMKILGLRPNKVYVDATSLRYGHLMIMADQDHDGSHIKGLLINLFYKFWPSLLRVQGFLLEFITPIVTVTKESTKDNPRYFYTMPEYEVWNKSLGEEKAREYNIKYHQGLGTSNHKDGRKYFDDLEKHIKEFVWGADDKDGNAIDLTFCKKNTQERKRALRKLKEDGTFIDSNKKDIPYREFIDKEHILYSMADLQRSIPSMVDGLKPAQRKILHCAFKKPIFKEVKVAQFSGYVAEHSAYRHGEQSLVNTIIGMAQSYVGSNNINLLHPSGQFGTRRMGGKDHASGRYIYTKLCSITRTLFNKSDELVLPSQNEDGQSIEPRWFMPIIPMVLVNGCEGIGTGWSTFVPNYSPRTIIDNIRRLLRGEEVVAMEPWYKGFRGEIKKSIGKATAYTTSGVAKEDGPTKLIISELPIRKWTQEYEDFLEAAAILGKNQIIEGYDAFNDVNIVNFEVMMSATQMNKAKEMGILKKFKLTTKLNTNNMHLFDREGELQKYETSEQILEEFFSLRLEYYQKRKTAMLRELDEAVKELTSKARFIDELLKGTINLMNKPKGELYDELRAKEYKEIPDVVAGETIPLTGYKYLLSMELGMLTHEDKAQLDAEVRDKERMYRKLNVTSPQDLWLEDLQALEKDLDDLEEQDRRDEEDELERWKQRKEARA